MVNYPHKVSSRNSLKFPKKKSVDFANRGMSFEKMINATNDYYLSQGVAVIHKKPTPIQIVRVDYPPKEVEPRSLKPTSDKPQPQTIRGVYDGYYIDFEVKETRQKHAIPMKNFHLHQIQHMEQVLAQQGICFVLLHFSSQQETYLLPAYDLIRFYHQDKGQKSMPLGYIREYGYQIKLGAFPQIPYLDVIKEHLLGGKQDE